MTDRMPRDDAEHDALLAKHGFPTDAVPRGIRADMSDPGFSFVNRDGIKLRNWICVLDGVIIDGHQGSDLWPGDGCIMCNRDWRRSTTMAEECRSCHAEIDWAHKPDDTKSNPIDHGSCDDPKGNLIIWRDDHGVLRYRYRRKGENPAPGEHTGISHYATCPDSARWRNRSRPGDDTRSQPGEYRGTGDRSAQDAVPRAAGATPTRGAQPPPDGPTVEE